MKELNLFNTHLCEWAQEDRPIYKLEHLGAEYLSNAELLAILINKGTKQHNAVDLCKIVLAKCNNNLNSLGKQSMHDLEQTSGIGVNKAAQILSAIEIGKRRQREKAEERVTVGSALAIYNYMHPIMQDLDHEEAYILLLNQHYRLLAKQRISSGGLSETSVDVRIIMRNALLANATIIVLIHNHPSNSNIPSSEDDRLTHRVQKASEVMRLYFADHVILTDGNYYSYREQGRM